MPGAISRAPRSSKGKRALSNSSAGDITSFTRVSKLQSLGKDVADKLASSQTTPTRPPAIEIVLKSRKRSADDDFEVVSTTPQSSHKKARKETEASPSHPIAPLKRKKKTVTFALPEAPVVAKAKLAPTPYPRKRQFQADDNASSEAEALLGQLNLQSSPTHKRSRTTSARTTTTTTQDDADLPSELLDLVDLHIAFLKTLSMSYAHQSRHAPIDLRTLFSAVTRAWGKRQVTLDDIRLCVGILSWSPTKVTAPPIPFFLADYGRSKICIESHADAAPGPLREPKLAMDFESNLRALWTASRGQPVHLFFATLPKAPLKPCAVVHPVLAKGQRTLTELKNGVVRKPQPQPEPATIVVPTTNPDGSKPSLLDRLRLKALAASQSPAGPTPAELMRQAALHRAEDVAAVIAMLCVATAGGMGRVAFPMATLLTKLRDSLRSPVSTEDGACCVRLLAGEVAPGWLRVVTVGGRENVVVTVAGQPAKGVIGERVKVLLG